MLEFGSTENILAATAFMPHGTCYLWKPSLVGLHAISNSIIALSYFSIPIALVHIARKRPDIPFHRLFLLFAAFIVACGTGHLLDVWTLWHPSYWVSGIVRAITAAVSLGTAYAIAYFVPQILTLPSPEQMEEVNALLLAEIQERKTAQTQLQKEQQFLKALLENLSDGIVACNAEGELTLFNRANLELHGRPPAPVSADRWAQDYDLYRPDGKTLMSKEEIPLFRALQGETVRDVEIAIAPEGRSPRLLLASGAPILTPEGKKLGAVVATRDVTDSRQAEAALKKSEERWQLALIGTGDGIFDWDIVTGEAFMSPVLKEMLGYCDSDVENTYEGWEKLVHPDDLQDVVDVLQAHLERKIPQYAIEYRMRCKDGSYKWILARGKTKWDEAGNPIRMVGSLQDISDRKQGETQLRESLERYQLLAENSSDLIATQTLDGVYLYVSPTCRSLLGYNPQTLIGRSFYEFLHPEDAAALQKTRALIPRFPEEYTYSYRMRRQDGTYIWLETTHKTSIAPDYNNLPVVVSIARDITERKQTEADLMALNQELEQQLSERKSKLKAVSRLYRSVVNSVREVIFQTDTVGRWIFLSPAWSEIVGFTVDESLNTSLLDYVYSPEDRQRIIVLFQELLALRRKSFRCEFRSPTKSGEFRWLEIYANVEQNEDGAVIGTYGTLNDITERKQAEAILKARADELTKQKQQIYLQNLQLQEASRLKSEFFAVMSHELRTPLNAIMGFSQMLQLQHYGPLTPRQADMVDRIFNNSQSLLAMLNEVLDFSKIEAGGWPLQPESFDANALIQLAAEELRSLVQRKNLTLEVRCSLNHPHIFNDRNGVRRILVNLLSNAIKFTETGTVTVEMEEIGSDAIAITVKDTGIGIKEEDLETIFDAFRQVDQTLTRQHAGTGLGLAITQSLVQMMQGRIAVESEVGVGTAFRVELPRRVEV